MSKGFVYIMINPSFIKKVKIGITNKESEQRAKELFTTGVPEEFIVVYEELVDNCEEVERILHKRFESYRESRNREFFNIPIKVAIKELQKVARNSIVVEDDISKVSILKELKEKYPFYLKPDISEVSIAHTGSVCFLEIVRGSNYTDQIVERTDLSFIVTGGNDESLYFPPTNSVYENANKFINVFDPYSIINCTGLFTNEAASKVAEEYFRDKNNR